MLGVDYLFFSPIFPTLSKPGQVGIGLHVLDAFCAAAEPVPVFALGGITPSNLSECLQAGAWGAAVLSSILDADRPGRAVEEFLKVTV